MSLVAPATAIDVAILAAAWLLTYLLHSTVLLGGAFALTAWVRRMSLRWQDRLWKLALVGGLATASLQVGLGFEPFGGRVVLSPSRPAEAAAREIREIEVERPSPEVGDLGVLGGFERRSAELARSEDASVSRAGHALRAADEGARFAGPDRVDADLAGADPFGAGTRPDAAGASFAAAPASSAPLRTGADPRPSRRTRSAEPTGGARGLLAGEIAGRPWIALLWALWLAGAAAGLLAFARALARLRAHLAERVTLDDGPLRARLDALSARAGLRGRIRLTASPRIAAPLTHGMLRREICVPTRALTDLTPAQQEAMLGHELGHAIRRDPTWLGLCWMLERVLLVQPLNRVARARLVASAEMLCDDWSVHLTGRRLSLASCLTEVAQWVVGTPRALPAGVAAGMAGAPLTQRVERLLDAAPREVGHRGERWWLAVGLAGLGLVASAAPGFAAGWRVPAASRLDDVARPMPADEPAPQPSIERPETLDDDPDPALSAFDEAMASLRAEFDLLTLELRDLKRAAADAGGVDRIAPRLQDVERGHRALAAQLEAFQDLLPRALASVRTAQSTRPSPDRLSPPQRNESK